MWRGAGLLALVLALTWLGWGSVYVALAVATAIAGLFWPRFQTHSILIVSVLLSAATFTLVHAFLLDDFSLHVVWLYSAPSLPWYLKVANLWGGDEGTLLLLATLVALVALPLSRMGGWARAGALAVILYFACGAIIWSPFLSTPAQSLAEQPYRGMNAHLVHVWMAVHPILLFISYALFLAPIGLALQALVVGGDGSWKLAANWTVRIGWLTLSLALAFGMWWAYEDFTFGQIWHWDPVQTSVFAVWALATAHTHCLRRYWPNGQFAVLHPLLGLFTAAACLASLAVTRSPLLASSHRYVGETSLPLLVIGAIVITVVALVSGVLAGRSRPRAPRASEQVWLLRVGILLFVICAVVAISSLTIAYLSAAFELPRPAHLKPFFETLARWGTASELDAIRRVFAQWEVDDASVNDSLTVLFSIIGFVAGHIFLPASSSRLRWTISASAVLLAVLSAMAFKPIEAAYTGTGFTSSRTAANFAGLNVLIVAMSYAAFAAAWSAICAIWLRYPTQHLVSHTVPVTLIHLGASLALVAGIAATTLDTYVTKIIRYPDDVLSPIVFPDGHEVTLNVSEESVPTDGGRGTFQSVARVGWTLRRGSHIVEHADGHAVYRDARPPLSQQRGSVRLMCEMLDYRYARFVSDGKHMIHPFIHRGLWRDVQIWVPAVGYAPEAPGEGADSQAPKAAEMPIMLKTYPLLAWLWIGLSITLLGMVLLIGTQLRAHFRRHPSPG